MKEKEVGTRQLPTRLSGTEYDALKAYAVFTGQSMNEVLRAALKDYLVAHADEQFEAILGKARSDYRAALDKLAEL